MDTNTKSEKHLEKAYAHINARLLPFLGICYLVSYLDRVNVSFAKLQMQSDLAFSDFVYGLGAGIFFLGYVLFEVPSNLLLAKVGARKTLSRILVLWGIASVSMMFVQNITTFYLIRFLLGVFEAGFAPGMLLYLTYWYSDKRMARAIAILMCAAPLGGVIGAPISTWLMANYDGVYGLAGWQWMFLMEGLPAIMLGIIAFHFLVDTPEKAKWLSDLEKQALVLDLNSTERQPEQSFTQVLCDRRFYGYAAAYFCLICGIYAISFWLPAMLAESGITNMMEIGWYSAIPYLAAIVAMLILGFSSDRFYERYWHSLIALTVGTIALAISIYANSSFVITFISITIAAAFIFSAYSVFWTIPIASMTGVGAAGGIAAVNSIGLIGGIVSPAIIGWMASITGNLQSGFTIIIFILLAGITLMILNQSRLSTNNIEKK